MHQIHIRCCPYNSLYFSEKFCVGLTCWSIGNSKIPEVNVISCFKVLCQLYYTRIVMVFEVFVKANYDLIKTAYLAF